MFSRTPWRTLIYKTLDFQDLKILTAATAFYADSFTFFFTCTIRVYSQDLRNWPSRYMQESSSCRKFSG
jgi:hypothetical protein